MQKLKRRKIGFLAMAMAISLLLCGCGQEEQSQAQSQENWEQQALVESIEKDFETENLAYGTAVLETAGEDTQITSSGVYLFSGEYSESLYVNVERETDDGVVFLVLDGANFFGEFPICIWEAEEVVILLVDGKENKVVQGEVSVEDEETPSGAIYSKADLSIVGEGTLELSTEYNDGIKSQDDLYIEGGNIIVSAVDNGIMGKDYLQISNASIYVSAGGDGIKTTNEEEGKGDLLICSGEIEIYSENDCIQAEGNLQIDGGKFNLTSGGGFYEVLGEITLGEGSSSQSVETQEESKKAIKGFDILLVDGQYSISAYEDAINSDNNLVIVGGEYNIITGDDAIKSESNLTIYGGEINVENGYEGIESTNITINGGNISINVLDDAINASESYSLLVINGGNIKLWSMGDGIDSNGDLIVTGGYVVLDITPIHSGGDGAVDVSGEIEIASGTLFDASGNEITGNTVFGGGMQGQGGMHGGMLEQGGTQGGMQGGTLEQGGTQGGMQERPR